MSHRKPEQNVCAVVWMDESTPYSPETDTDFCFPQDFWNFLVKRNEDTDFSTKGDAYQAIYFPYDALTEDNEEEFWQKLRVIFEASRQDWEARKKQALSSE